MDEIIINIEEIIDPVSVNITESTDNIAIVVSEAVKGDKGDTGSQGVQGVAGSDATVTKVNVEAVLTGEISTHTHPVVPSGLSSAQVFALINI